MPGLHDASSNLVYMADNTSTTWLGGFAPSSSGSVGNSQCTIAGTNSSPNPTSSGTQLGLMLNVTFNAASFSGNQNEYLYALDGSGVSTGWQQMGTWTVPAPPAPDFTLTAVTDSYYVQTGFIEPVVHADRHTTEWLQQPGVLQHVVAPLDTFFPYPLVDPTRFWDSPGIPLAYPPSVEITDAISFDAYLMWNPGTSGAIFVP